ncbi:unnamed protein product [Urochloa humidicola]
MSPLKRRRRASTAAAPPEEATTTPALPSDLVLEIAARSDAATLVRCAACCKPLRRDILNPSFIRRVYHRPGASVPPRLLAFLQSYRYHITPSGSSPPLPPFTLAHPATPAAAHLSDKHIAPFVSRAAGSLLANYEPVTSRGGLVVFRRRSHTGVSQESGIRVYDPMTGSSWTRRRWRTSHRTMASPRTPCSPPPATASAAAPHSSSSPWISQASCTPRRASGSGPSPSPSAPAAEAAN